MMDIFYLGLIISGLTLLGCVSYLAREWSAGETENG